MTEAASEKEDASTLFIAQDEAMDTISHDVNHAEPELNPTSVIETPHKRITADPGTSTNSTPTPRKRQRVNPNQVAKYDDGQEKKHSKLAVDQPCFKEAEKLVPAICDLVIKNAEELQNRGYRDGEITNIVAKLKVYRFVSKAYPTSKPVGFLGDTAAGKSSLINCLVNQENIAAECDDGHSGTSVIQELAMSDLDQVDTLRAIVCYHSDRKIDTIIQKHLQNIFDFNKNVDNQDLDTDEFTVIEAANTTALEFFTSLLCGLKEFNSTDATSAYFGKAVSREEEVVLKELKTFVTEYMSTLERVEGITIIEGGTMQEINLKLKCYKGPVSSAKGAAPVPSPWPLVRKITTHLHARILSEGAVLADLPGTSDTNKTRVQATRDYIKLCDTIIVAHPIIRVTTQDSLWYNVNECIRGGKQNNIVIVCTKIDDIKHGRERDMSEKDRMILGDLQAKAEILAGEAEDLREQLEDAEVNQDEDYMNINRELKNKLKQKAAAEQIWKEENILMRNRRNIQALQSKFREITRSNIEVPVFCVSNTIYQQHMKGYDITSPPDLSVTATDIPRLRQFLFEGPAKRKVGALMKLCKRDLPRVLLAIEMQCSKTRLERKQEVECKVVQPLNMFKELMSSMRIRLKHEFETAMNGAIFQHENEWKEAAKAMHATWVKYKYSRYFAFCRHDGEWKIGKEEVQWNGLVSEIAEEDLLEAFSRFTTSLESVKGAFLSNLDELLERLDTDLRESPELMGLNLDTFHKVIDLTRTTVDDNTTKLFRKLEGAVNNIRYHATSAETSDSYVAKSMQLAYDNCKLRSGAGVFKQLKDVISTKLTGPKNVFLDMTDGAIAEFEQYVDRWVASVDREIGQEFQNIVTDFNRRFDNVEPEDETKRQFKKELLQTVQKATKVMETEMHELLLECGTYR